MQTQSRATTVLLAIIAVLLSVALTSSSRDQGTPPERDEAVDAIRAQLENLPGQPITPRKSPLRERQ